MLLLKCSCFYLYIILSFSHFIVFCSVRIPNTKKRHSHIKGVSFLCYVQLTLTPISAGVQYQDEHWWCFWLMVLEHQLGHAKIKGQTTHLFHSTYECFWLSQFNKFPLLVMKFTCHQLNSILICGFWKVLIFGTKFQQTPIWASVNFECSLQSKSWVELSDLTP